MEKGTFRKDLFYRINVIEVNVSPLRDRLNAKSSGSKISISDDTIKVLKQYDFQGNIRELENILERAITMCDGNIIDVSDIGIEEKGGVKESSNDNYDSKEIGLEDYLVGIEKQTILDALNKTKWNKTAAAKLLGISFRALHCKLEKLGLN